MWAFNATKKFMKNVVSIVVEDKPLTDFRGNWKCVFDFYSRVQKTTDDREFEYLRTKLPEIEKCLDHIVDLLASEQEQYVRSVTDGSKVPPCFDYFLRQSAGHDESDSDEGDDSVRPAGASGGAFENNYVVFNICQYAKHDQPPGTRAIMLKTLFRIFTEADPKAHVSLLTVWPDFITMPLRDALHKISLTIHPREQQRTTVGGSPSSKAPPSGRAAKSDSLNTVLVHTDRMRFVALIRILCEKVEQIPSIYEMFALPASHVLLDNIVPYTEDSVLLLSHADRLTTYTNALRGILALAKTADPSIQDAVASKSRILHDVLHSLCSTLFTVCKIPPNAEIRLNMATIVESFRWLEAVLICAPHVAEVWELLPNFKDQVLGRSMMSLFGSADERPYVAVTTILTHVLKDGLTPGSAIANTICAVLTASRVDLEHHNLFSSTEQLPRNYEEVTTTFEDTFILPRLKDVSDTVVCCTLQLVTALALRTPHLFMRHCLKLNARRSPLYFSKSFLDGFAEGARERSKSGRDSTERDSSVQQSLQVNAVIGPRIRHLVPEITVDHLFPERLKASRGLCGTSLDGFAEDILRQMLEVEAALSPDEFTWHRPRAERTSRDGSVKHSDETQPQCVGTSAPDLSNVFFTAAVNEAPLVDIICDLVESMTEHCFNVNALLTDFVVAMCCLPDLRVVFTLLDPKVGKLSASIRRLSNRIDDILDREEKECGGANAMGALTKLALFTRCSQRPFFDAEDELFGDESTTAAVRSSKVFVDACVCLEGLRHELCNVVCNHVVSQALSELTSSPQRPLSAS